MPNMMGMAYLRWLRNQGYPAKFKDQDRPDNGWLITVKGLHSRRAPGNTCLGALRASDDLEAKNDSKGCGAVMRSAPFGVVCLDAFRDAVECAAIIHGHPLRQIPAGHLALIIKRIINEGQSIPQAVADQAEQLRDAPELRASISKALLAVETGRLCDIEEFGRVGWVTKPSQ